MIIIKFHSNLSVRVLFALSEKKLYQKIYNVRQLIIAGLEEVGRRWLAELLFVALEKLWFVVMLF